MLKDFGDLTVRPRLRGASAALLGALVVVLPASSVSAQRNTGKAQTEGTTKIVSLPIEGICSAGLADIREGLVGVEGISKVEGTMAGDGVQVTFAPQQVSSTRIVKIITHLGYRTGPAKIR